MQVSVYNKSGEVVDQVELDDGVFAVPMNEAVVHQALVRQMANRRQGTVETKTRGRVSGSTRKLFRQKHTGMARAGSRRSPLRRGGGVVFGPHPRSYRQAMPRKMRRLALRCALSAKAAGGGLKVLDAFGVGEPKTKEVVRLLAALGAGPSALLVTAEPDANLVKGGRNVKGVGVLTANLLSVADVLSYRELIMSLDAVRRAEALWGRGAPSEGEAVEASPGEPG